MARDLPWWKCPAHRAANPVWSALSLAARGLLATFDDAGDNEGRFTLPPGGLDAYVVSVAGARGAKAVKAAREALAELEAGGWFTVDGAVVVLHRHPAPRAVAPTVRPLDAAAVRMLRFYFTRRVRAFRDFPPGLTWESYLETPEGLAALQGHPPRPPPATPETSVATPPASSCNASATPLQRPPATPETLTNAGTQGVATDADRQIDTHTAHARERAREGEDPPEGDETEPRTVIATINERSQGRLTLQTLGGAAKLLPAFGDALRLAMSEGVTLEDVHRIGDHAAHDGFRWRHAPVDLKWLSRDLPSVLSGVVNCAECSSAQNARDSWEDMTNVTEQRLARERLGAALVTADARPTMADAFLAGCATFGEKRVDGVPDAMRASIEETIQRAKLNRREALLLGAAVANPERMGELGFGRRAPTLQELTRDDGARLLACVEALRRESAARREAAAREHGRDGGPHPAAARGGPPGGIGAAG